jgi:hypothetical protein
LNENSVFGSQGEDSLGSIFLQGNININKNKNSNNKNSISS